MKMPTYQDLSKEQDAINNLPLDGSYVVTGPPGTGKTVMALYRTSMISEKKEKATLLVFSRLLATYLGTAVNDLKLDGQVHTFQSWFLRFFRRQYKENAPMLGQWDPDYDEILARVNEEPSPKDSLDYLIIDEAQDLHPKFFPVARHIARRLTVFADENQQLRDENSTLDEIRTFAQIETPTHELRRNYRNTREIAAVAAHFYTGLSSGIPDPPQRGGEKPRLTGFNNLNDVVTFITRYETTNSSKSIGVFTKTDKFRKQLVNRFDGKTANDIRTYSYKTRDHVDFNKPGIVVVNYPSAKGLEFDTVIIPELQAVTDDATDASVRMRFYVLTSRAREELMFLYSGDRPPSVLADLPEGLLDRRQSQ